MRETEREGGRQRDRETESPPMRQVMPAASHIARFVAALRMPPDSAIYLCGRGTRTVHILSAQT